MRKSRSEAHGRGSRQRDLLALRGRESTSIAVAIYDDASQRLRLTYRPGGTYDYNDVPSHVIDEAVDASSLGQFVNWHIKPHYDCEKVG